MNSRAAAKWSAIAMVIAILGSLAYKFYPGDDGDTEKGVIAVVLPSATNQFWIDVQRGAQKAEIATEGYDVEIRSSLDQDASSQVSILNNFLSRQNLVALVLGPASDTEVVPTIAKYNKKNIPVVVVDTKLDAAQIATHNAHWDAFIGSNNRDGGEKAAVQMVELFEDAVGVEDHEPMTILLLEGNRVHSSAVDRADSFMEVATKLGAKVTKLNAAWKRSLAQELVASAFARGHYDGIFASNDDMAMGAIAALKSANIGAGDWPIIIGFDATRDAFAAIERGEMCHSIKQDSIGMGQQGVEAAIALLDNDPGVVKDRLLSVYVEPPNSVCVPGPR